MQCDLYRPNTNQIIQRWVVEEVKGSPPSPRFGHAQVFPVRNATHLPTFATQLFNSYLRQLLETVSMSLAAGLQRRYLSTEL